MKIIRRGTPPNETVFAGECWNCHTMIEAARRELKIENDFKDHSEYAHIACPVCNGIMTVHPKEKEK
jgi:hypothetical protein